MMRLLSFLFFPHKHILLYINIRRKTRVVKKSIVKFRERVQSARERGWETSERLNQIALYISIFSMDLTVLRARLVLERDEYAKNVYARQLAIMIYEFMQDYHKLFGKQFHEIISSLPKRGAHIRHFKSKKIDFNRLEKIHKKMLRDIRNIVAAHRDKNAEKQFDIMSTLSIETFEKLIDKLDIFVSDIVKLLTGVVEDYTNSPLMIREIANNVERIASAQRGATANDTNVNYKWIGQEFEEGLKLNPFPNELIYPNAKGEKLQIATDGKEKEIILSTMDNLNKVGKYYERNLPKNGWKKVIEGSYKNSKKSSLYFEKGNREALINISPDVGKHGVKSLHLTILLQEIEKSKSH